MVPWWVIRIIREVLQVSDGGGWYLLLLLCYYLAIVLHNREERRSALPSLLVGRSGRVMLAGCPGWPGWPGSLDYLPGAGSVQGMMGPALSVRWRHSVSTPGPQSDHRPQWQHVNYNYRTRADQTRGEKLSLHNTWVRLGLDNIIISDRVILPEDIHHWKRTFHTGIHLLVSRMFILDTICKTTSYLICYWIRYIRSI